MKWLSSAPKAAVLVAPGLILYTGIIIFSVVYSLYYSFTNARGFDEGHLIGGGNYAALASDSLFWRSFGNTGIILAIAIVVLIPAAFGLALLLNRRVPGSGALRALAFSPNILAPILAGLIWVFILDPKIGLINGALRSLGVADPPQWIGGHTLTPFSVGAVYIWSTIGFLMTIFYAGLSALPEDVLEAAEIDGATRGQRVRLVIVPMMRGTFAIVAVLVFTGALRIFELVFQLTGGGPVHLSDVLVSYMYYVTFTLQQYGSGMAIAVIITAVGAVGSLLYVVLLRKNAA